MQPVKVVVRCGNDLTILNIESRTDKHEQTRNTQVQYLAAQLIGTKKQPRYVLLH